MNSFWLTEFRGHLLQSTLFVVAIALVVFALLGNSARIRYWAWFIASAKFLVPVALFTAVGNRIGRRSLSIHIPRYDWFASGAVQGISTNGDARVTVADVPESAYTTLLLLCVWALGTMVVLFGWFALWRRITATLNSAIPVETGELVQTLRRLERTVGVRKFIRLAFSSAAFELGVFGILHPVLLLPNGIVNELDGDHIETVLLHEVNHVRRRDNLIAFLQMGTQAIFWSHPLVWWIESRLIIERERACDEEVLGLCSKPRVYAESNSESAPTARTCLEAVFLNGSHSEVRKPFVQELIWQNNYGISNAVLIRHGLAAKHDEAPATCFPKRNTICSLEPRKIAHLPVASWLT